VLFVEAISSLVAGLAGGVIQTTPYIGQPAYKKMGARAGYTLLTALFIGLAGFMGGLTVLFHLLPKVVLFPILIFVGLEITSQTFRVVNPKHYPALALAILPSLAYLGLLLIKSIYGPVLPGNPEAINAIQTLRCLANGFLISGMLWAAMMVSILDDKMSKASCYCFVAALLAFIGVIHSPLADETVGFPWAVLASIDKPFLEAVKVQSPYHWASGYLICAGLLLVLSKYGKAADEESAPREEFQSNASGKI
jgi:AGZA family xanthine/uracil permease-like MFS transporter